MRLIDADALKNKIPEVSADIFENCERCKLFDDVQIKDLIDFMPTIEAEPRWVSIKYRPMDEEEKQYWSEYMDADDEIEMFDCPMPEDGQEILVTFKSGYVNMDICEIDGGLYGLEENGDWDGVIAWMPLPEPYKMGEVME